MGAGTVRPRPNISMEIVDRFLTNMYSVRADFVYTVTQDFMSGCEPPILMLPDNVPAPPTPSRWKPCISRGTRR